MWAGLVPLFYKLAPVGAYGLIPKSPLASRTVYVVTVLCLETDEVTTWSFTTGD